MRARAFYHIAGHLKPFLYGAMIASANLYSGGYFVENGEEPQSPKGIEKAGLGSEFRPSIRIICAPICKSDDQIHLVVSAPIVCGLQCGGEMHLLASFVHRSLNDCKLEARYKVARAGSERMHTAVLLQ